MTSSVDLIRHGPGAYADADSPVERWGGRKAQAYTTLCLAEYGRVCWLCGLPGATSADHIIARDNGGAVYSLANLGPAHGPCNWARGKRTPIGPAAVIENGEEFFIPNGLDTHAQPRPVSFKPSNKTETDQEKSE